LKVCKSKSYDKGELIYQSGKSSHEMLILLQGGLVATSDSAALLGRIAPGTTTGEMGLLTNSPRSANVVATEKGAGFALKKDDLALLFTRNEPLKMKVYENLVSVLCARLGQPNVTMESRASSY
jgi:SulP family sulfate permease